MTKSNTGKDFSEWACLSFLVGHKMTLFGGKVLFCKDHKEVSTLWFINSTLRKLSL